MSPRHISGYRNFECRLNHVRLAVEAEMIAEGKGPGGSMNEDKKMQVAEVLTLLCHREENNKCTCPMGDFENCPFPEKDCEDVTDDDWKAWIEADE